MNHRGFFLSAEDAEHIWHPFTPLSASMENVPVMKANGVYVYDESGKAYIDAVSSWWVNIHGHCHPYIAQKLAEQFSVLDHIIFAGLTHPKAVELAQRLKKILPGTPDKIFYSDNGSTAVEVAIKIAIQYWFNRGIKKTKIIAFTDAYHGDTFGGMSVSGRGVFTRPFEPHMFSVEHIPLPQQTIPEKFIELCKDPEVIAFIYEPLVQGAAGMKMYHPELLDAMLALAQQNHIICIADEVMTGFGRTGKMFASNYMHHQPDITCVSKGITGGVLPLGVTAINKKITSAFEEKTGDQVFYHGHSYTANPLACAAACASLDLFDDKTFQSIEMIYQQHQQFAQRFALPGKVKDIRITGTILAIELHVPDEAGYHHPIKASAWNYFIKKGLILRPLGNVIYVLPPYCITEQELGIVYEAISEFIATL